MTHKFSNKNKLIIILIFFLSVNTFSQSSFIITNDNEKIIIDDNSVNVEVATEIIIYKLPKSEKKNIIKFKNIKTANLKDFKLERMKIGEEMDEKLCFIIADTKEKKLIGFNVISQNSIALGLNTGENRSNETFIYYILDKENKTLEKLKCTNVYGDKFGKERNNVEEALKKHFSSCKQLMDRLISSYDSNNNNIKQSKMIQKINKRMSESNFNIVLFFESPKFADCEEFVVQTKSLKNEEIKVNYGNTNYEIGVISIDFRGLKKDISFKGTYTIKEDFLTIDSNSGSAKYKIISYENGELKYDDEGVIQTINISSENGKIKGFNYNTKISFIDKKNGGGNICYYWCNKQ